MSIVTNVLLSYGVLEKTTAPDPGRGHASPPCDCMRRVNASLVAAGHPVPLLSIDCPVYGPEGAMVSGNVVGGSKHLECDVFAAAFNHLNIDAFVASVAGETWEEPDNVQLMMKRQDDERFTVATVTELRKALAEGRSWADLAYGSVL